MYNEEQFALPLYIYTNVIYCTIGAEHKLSII